MLFNSYQFIFLFLPIIWAGYFLLGRFSNWSPVVWLALASLVFYSVSNWQFVALLLASIAFNYVIGSLLIRAKLSSAARFAALSAGVAGDLLVLGYFKYAGFLAANLNALVSTQLTVNILLRSGFPFTPSPKSRFWSTPIAARSRAIDCPTTPCSSPIFRI